MAFREVMKVYCAFGEIKEKQWVCIFTLEYSL